MCFDRCLKGRPGVAFCGCTTMTGVRLVGMLSFVESIIVSMIFWSQLQHGLFNMKVFTWLLIVACRFLAYGALCCDSINQRRGFLYAMVGTAITEALLFIAFNATLFNSPAEELVLNSFIDWAVGSWVKILIVEALTLTHLLLAFYFISVGYDHLSMGCDDPALIDGEYKRLA